LEVATTDQADARLKAAQPSDLLPGQAASKTIHTATLVDIAAAWFLDDKGVLRRHRLRTRNCHSVRVPRDSEDRGLICVPRSLRQPLLTFYHERSSLQGAGAFWIFFRRNFGGPPW
jgi:hypothetical protein